MSHQGTGSQSQVHSGERKGVPNKLLELRRVCGGWYLAPFCSLINMFLLPGPRRAACLDTIWQAFAFLCVLHKAFAFNMLLLSRGRWENTRFQGSACFSSAFYWSLAFLPLIIKYKISTEKGYWIWHRMLLLEEISRNKRGFFYRSFPSATVILETSENSFAKLYWK